MYPRKRSRRRGRRRIKRESMHTLAEVSARPEDIRTTFIPETSSKYPLGLIHTPYIRNAVPARLSPPTSKYQEVIEPLTFRMYHKLYSWTHPYKKWACLIFLPLLFWVMPDQESLLKKMQPLAEQLSNRKITDSILPARHLPTARISPHACLSNASRSSKIALGLASMPTMYPRP